MTVFTVIVALTMLFVGWILGWTYHETRRINAKWLDVERIRGAQSGLRARIRSVSATKLEPLTKAAVDAHEKEVSRLERRNLILDAIVAVHADGVEKALELLEKEN